MSDRQITSGERYSIAALRTQGFHQAAIDVIARALGRNRSTISRELRRNIPIPGRYARMTGNGGR